MRLDLSLLYFKYTEETPQRTLTQNMSLTQVNKNEQNLLLGV